MTLKTTTILMLLLTILIAPGGSLAERSPDGAYYAGEGVVILCDGTPHSRLPQGDPGDHSTLQGWLLSGNPECLLSDVHNLDKEDRERVAYGGFAWIWYSSPTGMLSVTTIDEGSGAGNSHLTLFFENEQGEGISAEGCGPQSLWVDDVFSRWMSGGQYIVWSYIPPVGVDAEMTVCTATRGHVESTFVT